jgi:hypothetical protein
MSTIVKENIEPHAVVVDTNILFDQDKSKVVNFDFDAFWEKHATEANLQLLIPEVVVGEILFQQTTSALKTLSRANESFDRLSSFTGKSYSHRVNDTRVKTEIRSRFYCWAKVKKVRELATPISEIDWKNLISNSIWRLPPFSYDPKKEDLEKGFRDSLILETLVSYCESEIDKKIVFLSNDTLLREASEVRLKSDSTFSAFESIDDFEAYLRLEKENLEQSFIRSITNKAAKRFFKYRDKTSLVYTIDLMELLNENHEDKFKNPHTLIAEDFEGGFYSRGNWKVASSGIFSVEGKPQFQSIEDENTFFWISKVRYTRRYEGEFDLETEVPIFTHEVDFEINWKVNISLKERFTKLEFVNSKHIKSHFKRKND